MQLLGQCDPSHHQGLSHGSIADRMQMVGAGDLSAESCVSNAVGPASGLSLVSLDGRVGIATQTSSGTMRPRVRRAPALGTFLIDGFALFPSGCKRCSFPPVDLTPILPQRQQLAGQFKIPPKLLRRPAWSAHKLLQNLLGLAVTLASEPEVTRASPSVGCASVRTQSIRFPTGSTCWFDKRSRGVSGGDCLDSDLAHEIPRHVDAQTHPQQPARVMLDGRSTQRHH
jgi:hypothetical protein